MANAREFFRCLVETGFSPVRLDTIGRLMREAGQLPTTGRGRGAPPIGTHHGAIVLIAYAGAHTSSKAAQRWEKLHNLPSNADGRTLQAVLTSCLDGEENDVIELRISRRRRRAKLLQKNGPEILFARPGSRSLEGRFDVEGILDAALLKKVGDFLRSEVNATHHQINDDEEEDE